MFAEVITTAVRTSPTPVGQLRRHWTSPGGPDLHRYHLPSEPSQFSPPAISLFAFSVAGETSPPALAAGRPVIVKAHPAHPQLSLLTARIIDDALSEVGGILVCSHSSPV